MRTRTLGRTGLTVSVLGLGCGAVGGLMVRGSARRSGAGGGPCAGGRRQLFRHRPGLWRRPSETNLGRVLAKLKPALVLGTKLRLTVAEKSEHRRRRRRRHRGQPAPPRARYVDLYQLHNSITPDGADESLTLRMVLDAGGAGVPAPAPAGQDALHRHHRDWRNRRAARGRSQRRFPYRARSAYNMLNPRRRGAATGLSGAGLPASARAHDAAGIGTIGIRALAGGALSGSAERHPIASPRRSRSDRATITQPTWRAPKASAPWSMTVAPPRFPRPPCASPPAIPPSRRRSSASRPSSSSTLPRRPLPRATWPRRRWNNCVICVPHRVEPAVLLRAMLQCGRTDGARLAPSDSRQDKDSTADGGLDRPGDSGDGSGQPT